MSEIETLKMEPTAEARHNEKCKLVARILVAEAHEETEAGRAQREEQLKQANIDIITDAFRDGAKAERERILNMLRAPTQHLEDMMCQTLDTVKEPIVRRNKALGGPQWEVVENADNEDARAVFMTAELAHKEATRLFDMTWSRAALAAIADAIEADPT